MWSSASAASLKFCDASTLPARSGWAEAMPVSSTATFTPAPVHPAAHAVGAPISGTLSSKVACTTPSSQILVPAAGAAVRTRAERSCSPVSEAHSVDAWDFAVLIAWIPSRGIVRVTSRAVAAAVFGAAPGRPVTSTRIRSVCASSSRWATRAVTSNSSRSTCPLATAPQASFGRTYWRPFSANRANAVPRRRLAGVLPVTRRVPPVSW
jgi:hypothetical protein